MKLTVHLPTLSADNEQEIAEQIRADVETQQGMARQAAFIALRIGIRLAWLRDNAPRGGLLEFMERHFSRSRSTLYNYMRCADRFLQDAKLLDKTHKLTNASAVEPIVSEQLELFTDPEARLEGAARKLVQWVGERGLKDIYRQLDSHHAAPSSRGTRAPAGDLVRQLDIGREAALAQASQLAAMTKAEQFKSLTVDQLTHYVEAARDLLRAAEAELRGRRSRL